ncbi:MAG TPA: hypothetical protein VMI54_02480 [Polyangiaceae bacterium]|nr:hypothetical protein [Polyangiaceae bacterium]
MTSEDPTHADALERARSKRSQYRRYARFGGGQFMWLYAIGWPAVICAAYAVPCLVQGDLRDALPALGIGGVWALLVAGVVAFVTGSIRAAGRKLEAFAERVGGVAFRSSHPDRTLAWLDQHWADDVPRSMLHDPSGSAYFVGAEATYANTPVLVVAVRGNFWPRLHQIVLLAAPGARRPNEVARARVELGGLGYVVSTTPSGILVTHERTPASAFDFEHLDRVVRLLAELAGAEHAEHDVETKRALRAELRAQSIERFKHVLHFTQEELELNAGGRLSTAQRAMSALRGTLLALVALAAGGWAIYVTTQLIDPATRRDVGGGLLVIAVLSIIALGLSVVAVLVLEDAVDGHAALVLGPLRHTTTSGAKGSVHHWLHCGPMRFSTSAAITYAIEVNVRYRVYYSEHSHRLLSLEPAP